MPELSRIQIAVYGAIAVALLFVGARAVRGEGGEGSGGYTSSYDDYESGESGGEDEAGEEGGDESFAVSGEAGDIVVDVTGAVERPGVYRLPAGSRVDDAVKRAGGETGRADLDSLNLAAHLADGQQVVVPERASEGATGAAPGGAESASAVDEEGPIGLATATAAELDTITGIGPVTAEGIIGFREEHGGLSSIDQLDQISGIGPTTMEALRERLQP